MTTGTEPDKRGTDGRFLPGARFWEARSSAGRSPKFEDAETLRACCVEYFDWVDDNPLEEEKLFSYEGKIVRGNTAKMQAMTLVGLCLFLNISRQNWYEYKARPNYSDICEWVESVIYTQKFTGAAAGLMNPAIIARDLGLADRQEHSGPNGAPIKTEDCTPLETARRMAFIFATAMQEQKP